MAMDKDTEEHGEIDKRGSNGHVFTVPLSSL